MFVGFPVGTPPEAADLWEFCGAASAPASRRGHCRMSGSPAPLRSSPRGRPPTWEALKNIVSRVAADVVRRPGPDGGAAPDRDRRRSPGARDQASTRSSSRPGGGTGLHEPSTPRSPPSKRYSTQVPSPCLAGHPASRRTDRSRGRTEIPGDGGRSEAQHSSSRRRRLFVALALAGQEGEHARDFLMAKAGGFSRQHGFWSCSSTLPRCKVPASVDTRLSCPIRRESEKWVRHAAHLRRSTRSSR